MRVNIFIRKENEDKWLRIANKSNWVNTILSNSDDTSSWGEVRETPAGRMTTVLTEEVTPSIPQTTPVKNSNFSFCKNGHPIPNGRENCLGKGCKYS